MCVCVGGGGERERGEVWGLNYIRCAAHGLLYFLGGNRGKGTGLVSALLYFASLCRLRADVNVDVGKAAHVLEKYALEEVLFHSVRVCVCVWGGGTCTGRAIYTPNDFCVDRKESGRKERERCETNR